MKQLFLSKFNKRIRLWHIVFLGSSLLAFLGIVVILFATTPRQPAGKMVARDHFSHLQIQTFEFDQDTTSFPWGYIQTPDWRELGMMSDDGARPARFAGRDLIEIKKLARHINSFDCRNVIASDELIQSLAASHSLYRLSIDAHELTSQSYKSIARCRHLGELNLYHFRCQDSNLARALAPLNQLFHVSLRDGSLGPESLAALHGRPTLMGLSLGNIELAEWKAPAGAATTFGLQKIDIYNCWPQAGINTLLAQYPRLNAVRLTGLSIDDTTCQTLCDLSGLELLRLDKTAITNDGIQYLLSHAPRIEMVSLMETPLGPDVLEYIQVASPSFRGLAIDSIAPPESSVESFVQRTPSLGSLTLPLDTYSPEFIERVSTLLRKRGGSLENSWNHSAAIRPEAAPTTGVNEPNPAE